MKRAKGDAMQRVRRAINDGRNESVATYNARILRAVRALLKERAEAAMSSVPVRSNKLSREWYLSLATGRKIYAAVLKGKRT